MDKEKLDELSVLDCYIIIFLDLPYYIRKMNVNLRENAVYAKEIALQAKDIFKEIITNPIPSSSSSEDKEVIESKDGESDEKNEKKDQKNEQKKKNEKKKNQ